MSRSIPLVIGTIILLLAGLARVSEASLLYGVDSIFVSASPDREFSYPPLTGLSNIGSAASPVQSTEGDLVKSVFVDTRDGFALGIGVDYSTRPDRDPNSGLSQASVRALAATAFTVKGVSIDPIPASIQLSGTFQGEIFDLTSEADIQLRVYEFDPNDLLGFDRDDAVGMDVSVLYFSEGADDDPPFFEDPPVFTKFRRTRDSPFDELLGEGEWAGSETLDFDLPASGNGIFIELWGFSDIVPIPGNPEGNGFDFLSTATLDINPPPGVTVTLATGQVFGQPSNVVPEPSTLAIFWAGLGGIGLVVGRWRRRRNTYCARQSLEEE